LVLEKFIEIAKKCENLNNFNSVLEIVCGLNHFTIQRLKQLWATISDKSKKDFQYLDDLMTSSNNFKLYRDELKIRKPPMIPYLGLFLRDLTYLAENSIIDESNTIDMELMKLIGGRILFVRRLQSVSYQLEADQAMLEQLNRIEPINDEEFLYQLSLKAEPSLWINPAGEQYDEASDSTTSHSNSSTGSDSEYDSSSLRALNAKAVPVGLESKILLSEQPIIDSSKANYSTAINSNDSIKTIDDKTSDAVITGNKDNEEEREDDQDNNNNNNNNAATNPITKSESRMSSKPKKIHRRLIKKNMPPKCNTVNVPEPLMPLFVAAEKQVDRYFANSVMDTNLGSIVNFDERYMLLRGSSLSFDFFRVAKEIFQLESSEDTRNFAFNFLFDLAHSIGKNDAKLFAQKMKLETPIEKLSAGPVHFSYTGWAYVDIHLDGSNPVPDDEKFSLHFDHPYSFEAYSWMNHESGGANKCSSNTKPASEFPVCIMNIGYASGWTGYSFDLPLVGSEIQCQARGDPTCRFIMSSSNTIHANVGKYCDERSVATKARKKIFIPSFLDSNKNYSVTSSGVVSESKGKSWFLKGINSISSSRKFFSKLFGPQLATFISPNTSPSDASREAQKMKQSSMALKELTEQISKQTLQRFGQLKCDPRHANIHFEQRPSERYIFVRARALSSDFVSLMAELFGADGKDEVINFSIQFLYDLGRSMGRSDLLNLSSMFNTLAEKILAMPTVMALTGWGKLEILADSKLPFSVSSSTSSSSIPLLSKSSSLSSSSNQNSTISIRCNLFGSCEAASWILHKQLQSHQAKPINECILCCGYLSGWIGAAVGMKLVTVELSCMAKGAQCCSFLISLPKDIEEQVKDTLVAKGRNPAEMDDILLLQQMKKQK